MWPRRSFDGRVKNIEYGLAIVRVSRRLDKCVETKVVGLSCVKPQSSSSPDPDKQEGRRLSGKPRVIDEESSLLFARDNSMFSHQRREERRGEEPSRMRNKDERSLD